MKVVIQRVLRSSVSVNDEVISSIGRGLFVLVGISKNDTKKDMEYIIKKILNTRFFDDGDKRWAKNVVEKGYQVLCVSQFTLCYSFKGNKLDFHKAMSSHESKEFYNRFLNELRAKYKPEMVEDGKFGAYMQVDICNDGPVTIEIDSNPSDGASD